MNDIKDASDVLVHDNINWFGRSQTIVYKRGLAILELLYNNYNPSMACVNRLLVHETVRGSGMGNELLKIAEDIARGDGKDQLVIYADKTKPEIAVWYSDNDFVIVDTTENEYKMVKNITTKLNKDEAD